MSMGNFIPSSVVVGSCMAAPNPSPRKSPASEATESGVGMAHPTVVPTNFDPADDSERDE